MTSDRRPPVRTLHEYAVNALGVQIVSGAYPPGSSLLPEEQLGDSLGVSRTVAREAVKALAAKGLLSVGPKVGTRVKPRMQWSLLDPDVVRWHMENPDPKFRADILEIRAALEPVVARLAAERADSSAVDRLRVLHQQMTESLGLNDPEHVRADEKFHDELAHATGNDLLILVMDTISGWAHVGRTITPKIRSKQKRKRDVLQHQDVLHAVETRDGAAAENAMKTMMNDIVAEARLHRDD